MERVYIGFVHEEEGGGYWMDFPSLPGCFADGAEMEELAANAKDAVALYLEGLAEEGKAAPEVSKPTPGEMRKAKASMMLGIPAEIGDKAIRINITVGNSLLETIDSYVSRNGEYHRSSFLAMAAKRMLSENRRHAS